MNRELHLVRLASPLNIKLKAAELFNTDRIVIGFYFKVGRKIRVELRVNRSPGIQI